MVSVLEPLIGQRPQKMKKVIFFSFLLTLALYSCQKQSLEPVGNTLPFENGDIRLELAASSVPSFIRDIHFFNESEGIAITNDGKIYRTSDKGVTWELKFIDPHPDQIYFQILFLDENIGYVVGGNTGCGGNDCIPAGGTILKTTNGGLVFISQNSEIIPEDFTLHQNYPNPFNAGTIIKYDLKTSGFVELKIYDVTGKEILNLVSEEQSEGSYSVLFSTNENDKQLNSGFFFTHYI